jgi:hypothetical protein
VSVNNEHITVRVALLAILALGLMGTALELLFIDHDETLLQFVPLIVIGLSLAAIAWHVLSESSASRRMLGVTMVTLIASGVLGVVLHYRASVEFQKEIDPTLQGFTLLAKAIRSKAPPALAPVAMTWFGLLGLVCRYLAPDRRKQI